MSILSDIMGGGDWFGDFAGDAIGSIFGGGGGGNQGGGGGGGYAGGGGAMGTGGPFNFNVPAQPSQNIAWSTPDPYANYDPRFSDAIAGLYPGLIDQFTNAGQMSPDQQSAYDAMMQATNMQPGYDNAMGFLNNQFNIAGNTPRPGQYAPGSNALQNNAANLFNDPNYATGATNPSLSLLNNAQNTGAGQGQQSLMNALYGQATGGNQGLSDVQGYLSKTLNPTFTTELNPQVKAVTDAIKAQQQQLLEESRGRTLLDQNMYGAISSSGTAGQLGELERKFNLDMGNVNSQALLNQFNTQQQLQERAAGLGSSVSQIPSNLMSNLLGQGRAQGEFNLSMIPQLQDIYNQQGNRAGQQFGIGQQLWGNQNVGLQNQWNQYNQANQNAQNAISPWLQMSQYPFQTAQNRWNIAGLPQQWKNQQQNQYGGLLSNFGQFGQQQWQQPTGYVYNQPADSNWYDPLLNQGATNIANWGWNQLGDWLGGNGGGGGGGGNFDTTLTNPNIGGGVYTVGGGGGYPDYTLNGGGGYQPPTVGGGMDLNIKPPWEG